MIPDLQLVLLALSGLVAPPIGAPTASQAQQAPIVITRRLPPSPDLLVRTVNIGDLDLASAAGQQEMERRVGKAVDDMCAIPAPIGYYGPQMEKPCRDEAWESARWQMKDLAQRASRGK